ncbi:LruC domain-containing protein [Pedobacter sp. SYP-B3415]|uniref:LruC domain-containing protein n=1 Tax=Pedobacter sp. SYP-B3415 TaxID=2496641 RepID=UPI00101DDBC2|nr:LruC domain-containing protein [Pedobacter sp. SYP-B3415]
MKKLLPILPVLAVLAISSCKKETGTNQEIPGSEKAAPDGFAYNTTRKVSINVRLLTRTNQPISHVLVSVFGTATQEKGTELTKVMSDQDGYIKTTLNVPASETQLVVDPVYIGLARFVQVQITRNQTINAVIGGPDGYSGDVVSQKTSAVKESLVSPLASTAATSFIYDKSAFDALGRPLVREAVDNIDFSALLQEINHTLPESQVVKSKYIATEAPTDLTITKLADVWVTFVHEGADYRNSLGYYTYPTGQKPQTADQIGTIRLVFPNASLKGGRGEGSMIQGDKVKIGRFGAGTSIGFVLLQNAYRNDGSVDFNAQKFYTNENLNPESGNLKRHNVLLNNNNQKTFIVGFEDINRTAGHGSDQDFNDLMFYAQSNPVEAISPEGIPFLDTQIVDTDGDGIPDESDAYPTDPERAYNRFYPSESVWGTLAFEDQWPKVADYDMNDLVVSYRYKFAISAANKVKDLTAEYKPLAAGASFQNGFGIAISGLAPAQVTSVTGSSLSSGTYIRTNANGLEAGHNEAVAIAFDNYRNLFGAGSSMINTNPDGQKIAGTPVTLKFLFSAGLNDEFTASAPFNPFMISELDRGREVHLVNHKPTALAKGSFLGTEGDSSVPATGRFYITADNRPFAIDIFGSFLYPVETKSISSAYLHFDAWAKSGGSTYADWYINTVGGYRNNANIYSR